VDIEGTMVQQPWGVLHTLNQMVNQIFNRWLAADVVLAALTVR